MRKRSTLIVGSALALIAAIAASVAVAGPAVTGADGNSQSIDVKIAPKKLSKSKLTPGTLEVTTKVTNSVRPGGVPVPATRVVVDFDKTAKLFTKGLPTCAPAKLQSVSTEVAERECKGAIIGGGESRSAAAGRGKNLPRRPGGDRFQRSPAGR